MQNADTGIAAVNIAEVLNNNTTSPLSSAAQMGFDTGTNTTTATSGIFFQSNGSDEYHVSVENHFPISSTSLVVIEELSDKVKLNLLKLTFICMDSTFFSSMHRKPNVLNPHVF